MVQIINNFIKLFYKYRDSLTPKELNYYAKQLEKYGYSIRLKRYNDKLLVFIESNGFMNSIRNQFAKEHNHNIQLKPYMSLN